MCQIKKRAHYYTKVALSTYFQLTILSRPFQAEIRGKIVGLTLKTVADNTGKDHLTVVCGAIHSANQFYFTKSYQAYQAMDFHLNFAALRKNPSSLKEMAKVKIATSEV